MLGSFQFCSIAYLSSVTIIGSPPRGLQILSTSGDIVLMEHSSLDTAGPGVIQHMWFTGYVGHHFIIRMYWDDQEYPSVEAPLSAFFGCAYDENFVDRDGTVSYTHLDVYKRQVFLYRVSF